MVVEAPTRRASAAAAGSRSSLRRGDTSELFLTTSSLPTENLLRLEEGQGFKQS